MGACSVFGESSELFEQKVIISKKKKIMQTGLGESLTKMESIKTKRRG